MDGGFLFVLIVSMLVTGAVGYALLASRGRGGIGFALGALLGPIGWIVAAIMRLEKPGGASPIARATGTKFCSNCGAVIDATARFCNACGHQVAS